MRFIGFGNFRKSKSDEAFEPWFLKSNYLSNIKNKWIIVLHEFQVEKVKDKTRIMELVAKELADPERDCKRFDPGNYGAGC